MAAIASRRFAHWDDKHIVLANEEYCRNMYLPMGWQRIRIGILCAVNPNGTATLSDGTFHFGICSGKTAPVSGYNTDNFIGVSMNGTPAIGTTRTWAYTANTSWPYYNSNAGGYFYRKFGQSFSVSGSTFAYLLPVAGAGNLRRKVPFWLDITRQSGGSGAVTLTSYALTTAALLQIDYRPDHLLDGLDQVGTPIVNQQTPTVVTTTLTVAEGAGLLDTLCVYWGRTMFPLEVYAIGANVFNDSPYDGNTSGMLDTFETYANGTITNAGTITAGTGWTTTAAFYGTSHLTAPTVGSVAYAGTIFGGPFDAFETYDITQTGTSIITAGSGWSSAAVFYGTSNFPGSGTGYAGTASGFPYDVFEAYALGSVTPTTLSAGTGWLGNGIIYP